MHPVQHRPPPPVISRRNHRTGRPSPAAPGLD
jgi:hypothetical protein